MDTCYEFKYIIKFELLNKIYNIQRNETMGVSK